MVLLFCLLLWLLWFWFAGFRWGGLVAGWFLWWVCEGCCGLWWLIYCLLGCWCCDFASFLELVPAVRLGGLLCCFGLGLVYCYWMF